MYPYTPSPEIGNAFRGCLLGGAVGDALGAPVEFLRRTEILDQFGPGGIRNMAPVYGRVGAITDDTQMTLFTAEGIMRAYVRGSLRGISSPGAVINYAYQRWLKTQSESNAPNNQVDHDGWLIQCKELFSRRAPGNTCLSALKTNRYGRRAENNSKGCGGVMRVAPIGMLYRSLTIESPSFVDSNYEKSFQVGSEAAAITHGHPTGYLTGGVMAALVYDLLGGCQLNEALDRASAILLNHDNHEETSAAINLARHLHKTGVATDKAITELGEGWVAEEALAIGIYSALAAESFEHGVVMAVNHDGDSDSTGLIAGHLLGAQLGVASIPNHWLAPLELRSEMERLADDLATCGCWKLSDGYEPELQEETDRIFEDYPGC